MRNCILISLISIVMLTIACKDPSPTKIIPDISHVKLNDFKFVRFDKEVAQLDTLNIEESYNKLLVEHPKLTDIYFKSLLSFKHDDLDSYYESIAQLLKADEIKKLYGMVNKTYKDDSDVVSDLKEACRYLKHYFPEYQTPNFYTYITEFGYQTIIFPDEDIITGNGGKPQGPNQDGIGIGLDMYLSPEFDYKNVDPREPVFSDYLTRSYNRDHIAKKSMDLVAADLIGESPGKRMIDQMIHNGKKFYVLQQLLPMHSDTIISEYSSDQLKWLYDNELQIWDYFLENKYKPKPIVDRPNLN